MSVIKNIIDKFDTSKEGAEATKETLSILMDLCEEKANNFEGQIKADLLAGKTVDNLSIPITHTLSITKEYRSFVKDDTHGEKELISSISECVSGFFNGDSNIATGITNVIKSGLDIIMGASEGEESVVQKYLVIAEYPAIVRYDFAFWGRKIKSQSIKTYMEDAFSCVAYKSAVDVSKLAFNDFLALYGPILRNAFKDNSSKIKEFINEAKDIYKLLLPEDNKSHFKGSANLNDIIINSKLPEPVVTREFVERKGF